MSCDAAHSASGKPTATSGRRQTLILTLTRCDHDPLRLNRIEISSSLSMIFSENRLPLCANVPLRVRIMLEPYFQGVTGGTLSVAGGTSTVLKSAGLTIS